MGICYLVFTVVGSVFECVPLESFSNPSCETKALETIDVLVDVGKIWTKALLVEDVH